MNLSFKNEFEDENELAKNRYLSKRIESTLIVNQFRVNPWKIRCGSLHRDEDSLVLFHTGEYNTFATYLFRRWAYVWLSGKKDTEVVPGERQPHPRCVFRAARFFTAKLSFFEFLPMRRQAEIFVLYFCLFLFLVVTRWDRKKKNMRNVCHSPISFVIDQNIIVYLSFLNYVIFNFRMRYVVLWSFGCRLFYKYLWNISVFVIVF